MAAADETTSNILHLMANAEVREVTSPAEETEDDIYVMSNGEEIHLLTPYEAKGRRRPNFSKSEILTLMEEVTSRKAIICSRLTTSNNEAKKEVWNEVAAKVNLVAKTPRTPVELRTKFKQLKKVIKVRVAAKGWLEKEGTGGVTSREKLSPIEEKMMPFLLVTGQETESPSAEDKGGCEKMAAVEKTPSNVCVEANIEHRRQPNYTEKETDVLVKEVASRKTVICGPLDPLSGITKEAKEAAWSEVTQAVNQVAEFPRSPHDLRVKFKHLKSNFKKKVIEINLKRMRGGEDGELPTEERLTPSQKTLLDLFQTSSKDVKSLPIPDSECGRVNVSGTAAADSVRGARNEFVIVIGDQNEVMSAVPESKIRFSTQSSSPPASSDPLQPLPSPSPSPPEPYPSRQSKKGRKRKAPGIDLSEEEELLAPQILKVNEEIRDLLAGLVMTQKEMVAMQREAVEVQRAMAVTQRDTAAALMKIAEKSTTVLAVAKGRGVFKK